MAITTSAQDGVRCTSAAKESAGAASTLGSQAGANADQVIVPDAITANNEGNLEASPSYINRLIAIRPWEMKLTAATLAAAGSGYAASDVLTLSGGVAGPGGAPQITVDTVDGGGAILTFTISREASFAIRRGAMTGAPSPPDDSVATTGGTGTGATFDCVFAPHFEIRKVIAEPTANTLTVNEAWDVAPVSGDNWAVCYLMADYATLTGVTLRAQSGVYECTRDLRVGPSTDGTRHGWLGMLGGVATELDNVSDEAFEVENGGIWCVGYSQGGESVDGAYMSTSGNATPGAGPIIDFHSSMGSMIFLHDFNIRSPREQLEIGLNTTTYTAEDAKFRREVGAILSRAKFYDCGPTNYFEALIVRDLLMQASATTSGYDLTLTLKRTGSPSSGTEIFIDIDGLTLVNGQGASFVGFNWLNAGSTPPAWESPLLRNVTFIGDYVYVGAAGLSGTNFVNPKWSVDLTSQNNISFTNDNNPDNFVRPWFSLQVGVSDTDGADLSGAHCYIYETAINNGLTDDPTNQSDTDANGLYLTDVVFDFWMGDAAGIGILTAQRGGIAWRAYDYGNLPALIPLAPDGAPSTGFDGLELTATLIPDAAITEANQATALTNPTTNPTITFHEAGETDPRPMKALAYDAGTGGVPPSLGETLTQGTATGVVVDVKGDDVSGTVLMDTWNGVEFTDNQPITGGTSAFAATTDVATFYQEYTVEVDAQGEAMTVVYDYLAARMAEATLTAEFEKVMEWGGDDPDATQLIFNDGAAYFTNRSRRLLDLRLQENEAADYSDNFDGYTSGNALASNAAWDDNDSTANNQITVNGTTDKYVEVTSPGPATSQQTLNSVATATHTYANDQWAEMTIDQAGNGNITDDAGGPAVRVNGTDSCYAAFAWWGGDGTGTPEYRIVRLDPTSTIRPNVLARGTSTPALNDVMRLLVRGTQLVLFVNGVEECRAVDTTITSGQAGIASQADWGAAQQPSLRLDNFVSGDLPADADLLGKGVWVHNAGAGNFDFFTSDDGVQYQVPATVSIEITVLDENRVARQGAHVFFEIVDVGPPETTVLELINQKTGATGIVSASYTGTLPVNARRRIRDSSAAVSPKYKFETDLVIVDSNGYTETIELERQFILEGQN